MKKQWGIALLGGLLAVQGVHAEDGADTSGVTAQDLLQLLIEEGVVDKAKVKALADRIKARRREAAGAAVENVAAESKDVKPAAPDGVVRVPYIPEYIRDEIRDEVRAGLRDDVSQDILAKAKQERWGLPGALPEWTSRISFSGDMRVREESTLYAKDNIQGSYEDVARINAKGKLDFSDPYFFLNTTEDRHRLRGRFRFAVKARVNDRIEAGARLVTGNQADPVSTNQTLGNYGQKWQTAFDLGYLKYVSPAHSVEVSGGRFSNPFLSTDLVWDSDLTFEGVAASWRMLRSQPGDAGQGFDPFVTAGAFPLQEVERGSDKWLYGAQTGVRYVWGNRSSLTAAVAYYAYDNIVGKRNSTEDTALNYTAPPYLQKGNTLFNIINSSSVETVLYAHAVDYKLADAFVEYDLADFAPIHVLLTLDYVKNLGFDKREVADRLGFAIDGKTTGYQARVALGYPQVRRLNDWQVSFTYRYLERDAVLAEFTDSDFHGGGTDAMGYELKFDYGIADNTWLTLRWLSADEIDGDTYPDVSGYGTGRLGIDTLQLDLNAKF